MIIKKHLLLLVIAILFFTTGNTWSQTNEPPVLTATGDQLYCPGNSIKIVTDLIITDPDDTGVEAVFVQISEGYIKNQDLLTLTGIHPNITTTWNSTTAKLELRGVSGGKVLYSDFVLAILDVEFSTSNTLATGDRSFSITIGDANYLPSTGHFYEFVASEGITWTNAKVAAENRTYFGLEGYLVTITSTAEKQLTGEQAPGTGWIGGSDSASEGIWKWMTGPEAGTIFWNGLANGSTPNYAFWNNQEPNNANSEDYAHITHPDLPGAIPGSWNDLANTGGPDLYIPKGYLVEYGGMPNDPVLNISASTIIRIPEITNSVSNSRCGDGTVILEATSDLGVINWYDAQSGGNLVTTGTNFTTPIITNTTTYYAVAGVNAGCTGGQRVPVTATIDKIPSIDQTSGSIICFNGIGDIYATPSIGSIVNWYDAAIGGTKLGTGNAYVTSNINVTTLFYAEAATAFCVSTARVPVEVTVNSPSEPTGNSIQYFCEKDNSKISELTTLTGNNITWYDALTGGTSYTGTEALIDGLSYFASQIDGICESQDRLEVMVTIYKSVTPLLPTDIPTMSVCDTNTDGNDTNNIATFNLRNHESILINGETLSDFTFTYFLDAGYVNLIGNPTAFENTIAKTQTIFVRMTNNSDINCFTDTSFNIKVLELPVVSTPNKYAQCDDSSNDGHALFNLTLNSIKEEISPNYIAEGLKFTYFETQIDAETNNGANISNPESYLDNSGLSTNKTIWIRIENPNGCFRVETIELEVNPSSGALASYNPKLFRCDDGSDLRDGVSTFDLTAIQNHIKTVIFPTFNVTVLFYESLNDAELENNEVLNIANHQNTNSPNIQNIWVRVKSDLGNNCLGLEDFPSLLNVEALPIANALTTFITCDDDQNGIFSFNTSNLESNILMGQSLADVAVSYFDSFGNPLQDFSGNLISSPFPNTFETTSSIINYTVTNISTNDPNGACFESNSVEFIVDQLPINNTVVIPPICDPEPDDGLLIGEFDTSTLESNIGAQPGMDISYFDASMNPLVDANGNTVSSPFPSTFTSGTQIINVVVSNPLNVSCPITNTIDFTVNALPEFTVESTRIICESGPNSTITLDVFQDNPSEVLDYEWTDDNGGYISNTQSIDITSSGIYTVTLSKTNGTGCTRSKEINAIFSEKANLDYDDITIIDDSNNNSISINNEGQNLGKGDYEFSLDEYGPYQDEPVFENLLPGIYTVYVKDKDDCGISELEVSVVGFPKFFSPNNDGTNDNWKVLGINENFYSTSTIYIYDRFGKMIAKVNPLSEGWNGVYNGAILPSDDYWFSTILIDSDGNQKIRKGHFSLIRK